MISPKVFLQQLQENGISFFTGVPDSLLSDFLSYLSDSASQSHHVTTVNEGAAVALATGYHLATGKIPLCYLQNSGIGNAINPLVSLAHPAVYGIPMLLLVGWRGEPGVSDEPQHLHQGKIMPELLRAMEIPFAILGDTPEDGVETLKAAVNTARDQETPYVLLVRKGTFQSAEKKRVSGHTYPLRREEAIALITDHLSDTSLVVATTGMAGRELWECREKKAVGHERDFLNIGAMGHASHIALGIALQTPGKQIVCLDGDGSVLMHMGSLATAGLSSAGNFTHVVLNNGVHDSVGAQPSAGFGVDFVRIAQACGYKQSLRVETAEEIVKIFSSHAALPKPAFIEIRIRPGARDGLGRPTGTPNERKKSCMKFLQS